MGVSNYDIVSASAFIGGIGTYIPRSGGSVWYVDGTNGNNKSGKSPNEAMTTIQGAIDSAKAGDIIYVFPKNMGVDGDPGNYAEALTIGATLDNLSIIGIGRRTQCGLPQIKYAAGTSPLITIDAQGVTIANMGINGGSSTGGGILLNSDGATATKNAAGASILNCHFKNCVGSTATNAATGGAIMWSANGDAWQVLIQGNRFYKNVGDIVLKGTSNSVPQDVVIEDNIFSGPAANVDCHLYLKGGSGMNGVIIRNNSFTCWPAVGSGSNAMPLALTGCVGSLDGNRFSCTGKTFGAAGNALVPTTVLMAGNWQEDAIITRT
jgi:hypothetical protein